jgi:hypothetical protein
MENLDPGTSTCCQRLIDVAHGQKVAALPILLGAPAFDIDSGLPSRACIATVMSASA